jgi:hypothetical protein
LSKNGLHITGPRRDSGIFTRLGITELQHKKRQVTLPFFISLLLLAFTLSNKASALLIRATLRVFQ